ncbi:MAG: KAP family NTPase [Alphaproteobacteria bacterium]|nr:KAP family NTPase [Alphaproteobacteria bacterium]
MTSTEAVKNELEKFLKSPEAEVLCISGDLGVGKSFTWHSTLERLRKTHSISLARYSYVSLFGVSTLESVKTAIFENMEFLPPEGQTPLNALIKTGSAIATRSKKVLAVAGALVGFGEAVTRSQPLFFSAIRNQIVCIDDIERRHGVSIKEIFGLVSFLREQRGCKVVLLLNETRLREDAIAAQHFDSYFEKVIDSKLVFSPTPQEAAAIALETDDAIAKLVAEHCVRLQIANIRIIQKIERLVRSAAAALEAFEPAILRQAAHSLTMFAWCRFDVRANPPPLDFITQGPLSRHARRGSGTAPEKDPQEPRWSQILRSYGWGEVDRFDFELSRLIEVGVPDEQRIRQAATERVAHNKRLSRIGSFDDCLRLLYDSFDDNEEEVCSSLQDGFIRRFDVLSRRHLTDAVWLLRQLGHPSRADELVQFADQQGSTEFWTQEDPFGRPEEDETIAAIVERKRSAAAPPFVFEDALLEGERDNDPRRIAQLAASDDEKFVALFKARRGETLRNILRSSLNYRSHIGATGAMKEIVSRTERALNTIASESRLNEIRVRLRGVQRPAETTPDNQLDGSPATE